MFRALAGLALAVLLAACTSDPPSTTRPAATTGNLKIEIVGLPAGLDADVTVAGPGLAEAAVTASQEFVDVEPGEYTIEIADVLLGLDEYRPSGSYSRAVRVEAGKTTTDKVEYGRTYGSLRIDVTGLTGVDAAITVTGPEGYERTLQSGAELGGLVPGTYWIFAADVQSAGAYYEAPPIPAVVELKAGAHEDVVTVDYALLTGRVVVVKNVSDDVSTVDSLRYWLAESAAVDSDIARIDFDAASFTAPAVIQLAGELTIDHDIRIVGPTDATGSPLVTVIAANNSRVLNVGNQADAIVRNLRLTEGRSVGDGGAVFNGGTLAFFNMMISANTAGRGGGIYNDTDGALTLSHSQVSGNTARAEGGGIANLGIMHIIRSDVSLNESTGDGAGILNMNPVAELHVIQGSNITGNKISAAAGAGGGVHNRGGTVVIERSSVSGNEATTGGGLDTSVGTVLITNGSRIEGNTAENGGGVHNAGHLTVDGGSVVAGNVASSRGGGIYNAAAADVQALISSGVVERNEAQLGGGVWNGSGLEIRSNSHVQNNIATESGGGIYNSATGVAEVIESHISSNQVHDVGPGKGRGGGIRNLNVLNLTHSTVSSNRANEGGGLAVTGAGESRIANTTFASNTVEREGGGVLVADTGWAWLSDSTVRDNEAIQLGGAGISVLSSTASRLTDTTFTGNFAATNGGAIFTNGELGATNVTIVGNGARRGGGVFVSSGGKMDLFFSTVSLNETVEGSGRGTRDGGGIYHSGTLALRGTIVAGNGPDESSITGPDIFYSGATPISSHGYNVIGDDAAAGLPADARNLLNVDPLLGSLRNNGGRTQTMALLPGSPALGLVPTNECVYPSGIRLTRDQRDQLRPGPDGTCDAGAYQTQ